MAALQRQGWGQPRIAAKLGLSVGTVCRAMAARNRAVHKQLTAEAVQVAVQDVEVLGYCVEQLIAGFHQSKDKRTIMVRTVEESGLIGGSTQTTESVVKGGSGEPEYLDAARAAMADRRKLLGIGAPQGGESVRGDEFGPLVNQVYDPKPSSPDPSPPGPDPLPPGRP